MVVVAAGAAAAYLRGGRERAWAEAPAPVMAAAASAALKAKAAAGKQAVFRELQAKPGLFAPHPRALPTRPAAYCLPLTRFFFVFFYRRKPCVL